MKLLDEKLSEHEKYNILDLVKGNICRISVSDDEEEIVCMLGFAIDRLSFVAYSRIKEIKERQENE